MNISEDGLSLIKDFEKLVLHVYLDQGGKPTIGWGHLIKPGEHFTTITEERADELLLDDLAVAEYAVNSRVTVTLTQNQYDVLVDFTFNVGSGHFASSTLLRLLNQGDYDSVPAQLAKWKYVGGQVSNGLINRRNAEIKMWKGGCKCLGKQQ